MNLSTGCYWLTRKARELFGFSPDEAVTYDRFLSLDVRMPGMMGPELCDVMAARNIALPVIFLTGHADIFAGMDAWNEGAVVFLVKPVDAEALLQAIRLALERHAECLVSDSPKRRTGQKETLGIRAEVPF